MSSCVGGLNAGNECGFSGPREDPTFSATSRQGCGPDYRKSTTFRDGEF